MNLAHKFVHNIGKDIKGCRDEYDGSCIDFAGDMIDWLGQGRLAYFETPHNPRWRYHAAVEWRGFIHDLWQEEAMPLDCFMEKIGAIKVEYPTEADDEQEIHDQDLVHP